MRWAFRSDIRWMRRMFERPQARRAPDVESGVEDYLYGCCGMGPGQCFCLDECPCTGDSPCMTYEVWGADYEVYDRILAPTRPLRATFGELLSVI
jgi:hypothetical protein